MWPIHLRQAACVRCHCGRSALLSRSIRHDVVDQTATIASCSVHFPPQTSDAECTGETYVAPQTIHSSDYESTELKQSLCSTAARGRPWQSSNIAPAVEQLHKQMKGSSGKTRYKGAGCHASLAGVHVCMNSHLRLLRLPTQLHQRFQYALHHVFKYCLGELREYRHPNITLMTRRRNTDHVNRQLTPSPVAIMSGPVARIAAQVRKACAGSVHSQLYSTSPFVSKMAPCLKPVRLTTCLKDPRVVIPIRNDMEAPVRPGEEAIRLGRNGALGAGKKRLRSCVSCICMIWSPDYSPAPSRFCSPASLESKVGL